MKATGKEPMQATTPTRNIRDIASHEYEVPYLEAWEDMELRIHSRYCLS